LIENLNILGLFFGKSNEIKGIPSSVIYDILQIPHPTISSWKKKELIKPSVRKGRRGDKRVAEALWSFKDFVKIQTIKKFREKGLSMQKVRKVMDWLKKNDFEFNPIRLATNGNQVFWLLDSDRDQVIEVLEKTDQMIVLNWTDVVNSCIDSLKEYGIIVKLDSDRRDVESLENIA